MINVILTESEAQNVANLLRDNAVRMRRYIANTEPGDATEAGLAQYEQVAASDMALAQHFDPSNKSKTGNSFGHAIEAMKLGHKVAREGWNGKGMWVALTPGSSFDAILAKSGHAAVHRANELPTSKSQIVLLPHIDMRAADGSMVVGWLASQTDMLADDWQIVPD